MSASNRAEKTGIDTRKSLICKIYMDFRENAVKVPVIGDYILTMGTRRQSAYLVIEAREVKRTTRAIASRRIAMVCHRATVEEAKQTAYWPCYWYSRSKKAKT